MLRTWQSGNHLQYITWSSACQFPNTSSREFILATPSLLHRVSTPSFELSQADGKLPLRREGTNPLPYPRQEQQPSIQNIADKRLRRKRK